MHWLAWGLPAARPAIPAGVPGTAVAESVGGLRQGRNDFGEVGWGGPMPPRGHGVHHYRFTVYALRDPIDLEGGAGRSDLERAMEGMVLETARLVGTYERE